MTGFSKEQSEDRERYESFLSVEFIKSELEWMVPLSVNRQKEFNGFINKMIDWNRDLSKKRILKNGCEFPSNSKLRCYKKNFNEVLTTLVSDVNDYKSSLKYYDSNELLSEQTKRLFMHIRCLVNDLDKRLISTRMFYARCFYELENSGNMKIAS